MTVDSFYAFAGAVIFVPWLLLLFAPRWQHTQLIAAGAAIVMLIAAAWFTFQYLRHPDSGSLLTLNGWSGLFRSREMLVTGWLNYLSFSLFTGIWQVSDARDLKIPHIALVPGLLLTLIAGPTGLLLYLLIRFVRTRKWEVK
jgi:Domain of unknown function (DUF4281)